MTSLFSINSPPTRILKTFLQIYRKHCEDIIPHCVARSSTKRTRCHDFTVTTVTVTRLTRLSP
jgi:hypothetical protein